MNRAVYIAKIKELIEQAQRNLDDESFVFFIEELGELYEEYD